MSSRILAVDQNQVLVCWEARQISKSTEIHKMAQNNLCNCVFESYYAVSQNKLWAVKKRDRFILN